MLIPPHVVLDLSAMCHGVIGVIMIEIDENSSVLSIVEGDMIGNMCLYFISLMVHSGESLEIT